MADTDLEIAFDPALSDIQTSGDQLSKTFFIEHLSYPEKIEAQSEFPQQEK